MVKRLDESSTDDLCTLSEEADFPYKISKDDARFYCKGTDISEGVQTYGVYQENRLTGVMTATFCRVFPHCDSPSGKIIQLSGAYVHPDFRGQGNATALIKAIEEDAVIYGADYICTDSTADELYEKNGFNHAPENESRLWKRLA